MNQVLTIYHSKKYLLDNISSALLTYSLSKRKRNAQSCIRVQRNSDAAQQDVGFSNDQYNVSSINNFAGNNFTVAELYDQSGDAITASQSTTANQSTISNGYLNLNSNGYNFNLSNSFTGYLVLNCVNGVYLFGVSLPSGSNNLKTICSQFSGITDIILTPSLNDASKISNSLQKKNPNTFCAINNLTKGWAYCSGLTSFPLINTANASNLSYAWFGCSGLTSFPLINTANASNLSYAWFGCSGLTSFPTHMFDNCLAENYQQAFQYCALNQASVDNILVSIALSATNNNLINGRIDINGGTSSTPSSTGLAAKAALVAKGWNINTN